jgi:hypothetical protein
VRFAKAGWAAAAIVVLGSGGCDYWNNLVEEKTLTRADLAVTVIDAWTGDAFSDADCRDSLSGIELASDGQGEYRILGGATGLYEIRCDHIWYYRGAAKIHLAKAGAHDTVKLARRGEPENWYPPGGLRTVAIPRPNQGIVRVRFPTDLDWQVTPWDTTGRFRYEWTFRQATTLNHGHLNGQEQLDAESYSPRFRARATAEKIVREGKDTVILTVYSLMNGGPVGYPVGSDTMFIEWVRNRKPFIYFQAPFDSNPPTYKVGCVNVDTIARVNLLAGDSDGQCASIKFWTQNAPSVGIKEMTLTCEDLTPNLKLPLSRPAQPGRPRPDGSDEYENTLYAEITDDNGEKGRDSVTFLTYTNAPPGVGFSILGSSGGTYFVNDPVTFQVTGNDTDGGIQQLDVQWTRASDNHTRDEYSRPTNRLLESSGQYTLTTRFTEADTGTYRAVGIATDNCGDGTTSVSRSFAVVKDNRPIITFSHPDTTVKSGGDSLQVQFNLSVMDPDAQIVDRDSITFLRINWDTSAVYTNTNRVQSIMETKFNHTFPMPSPGTSLRIGIHVEDQHSGFADTAFRVP